MQFKKSKAGLILLSVLMSLNIFAMERFSSKQCLESSFKTKLAQRGPLFGLIPHELTIEKKNCIVKIKYQRYLPKEWSIDVCREPVHIKVSSLTGVDVAKKTEDCLKADNTRNTSNFCGQYFSLLDVIQDDGLIFAEGDRDSLNTPHGRIYCSYLLLDRYLGDGIVFSRYTEVPDVFKKMSTKLTKPAEVIDEVEPQVEVPPKAEETPNS